MKEIIAFEDFYRRESVEFFKGFVNPSVGVTCMVDGSKCLQRAKALNEKFFHHYLYAILRAVNEIEEMHYRFSRAGDIVRYDRIDVITPIKLPGQDHFTTMKFAYAPVREEFIAAINLAIDEAKNLSSFGVEDALNEFDVVLLSATPNLPFTSLTCTQRHSNGNDYPLLNVGQMGADGRMPLAISVHHAFVDGEHLAKFYQLVQKYLDSDKE